MAKSEETYVPGNIINFEQRRKEHAEREATAANEDDEGYGIDTPIDALSCTCGSTAVTMYTDYSHVMAECAECRTPMLWQIINFLRGDF